MTGVTIEQSGARKGTARVGSHLLEPLPFHESFVSQDTKRHGVSEGQVIVRVSVKWALSTLGLDMSVKK